MTIRDAYIVVSGLPVRNGNNHIREICEMSLDIRHEVQDFKIQHLPERELQLRIGIHCGKFYLTTFLSITVYT